ncbi:MAG: hypothetical protein IPO24_18670 [Bacteroidetes bacterium]|nr:hypothetical protein [Bacteroidota bacterium]
MRKLITTLLCAFTLIMAQAQIINIDEPSSYLPAGAPSVKLGIGIKDFQLINDTAKLKRDATVAYAYVAFKLDNPTTSINSATYKFDSPANNINLHRPLYEISFEFVDDAAADAFVTSKFTSMYRITEIADKEWFLSTNKDYWVIVRKTGKTVILAAMISGTEWGFE